MDPRLMPKGEFNYDDNAAGGVGSPNEPGVYYHPQAKTFVETACVQRPDGTTSYHVDSGRIQADAFVQMGYRPASPDEVKAYRDQLAAGKVKK